jgi:hypothetical protein
MSCAAGPNSVTNGLVLDMDMSNIEKSWKGAPTANLYDFSNSLVGMNNIVLTYLGKEDGWSKYSLSGTWGAGTYPYCFNTGTPPFNFIGTVLYSTQCYLKTNALAKFTTFAASYINYVNLPLSNAGSGVAIAQPDGSFYVNRAGFAYANTTQQPGYFFCQPLTGGVTFYPSTDFIWIKSAQIEQSPICNRYISGTNSIRSNTQAILDLTNNNILSANNITYNTSDSFSFNGANNYIDCGDVLDMGTNNLTCTAWIKVKAGMTIDGTILSKALAGGQSFRYAFILNTAYKLYAFVQGNGGADIVPVASTVLTPEKWYMVACVFNRESNIQIYLNGNLETLTGNSTISQWNSLDFQSNNPFRIGSYTSGNNIGIQNLFKGDIANLQQYNRALSADEIQQNFNATRGRYGI